MFISFSFAAFSANLSLYLLFFFAIIFSPSCANVSFLPGTLSLSLNTLLPSGKLTKLLSVGLLFSGTLLILPSGVYINSPSST
nr:MAG TPA: hypothetical protein [Caudoviricetes sp.]